MRKRCYSGKSEPPQKTNPPDPSSPWTRQAKSREESDLARAKPIPPRSSLPPTLPPLRTPVSTLALPNKIKKPSYMQRERRCYSGKSEPPPKTNPPCLSSLWTRQEKSPGESDLAHPRPTHLSASRPLPNTPTPPHPTPTPPSHQTAPPLNLLPHPKVGCFPPKAAHSPPHRSPLTPPAHQPLRRIVYNTLNHTNT